MNRRGFLKSIGKVVGGLTLVVPTLLITDEVKFISPLARMRKAEGTEAVKILRQAKVDMIIPGQKFQRGDRVHITKNMPEFMSHFHKDMDATVLYSYEERYGDPKNREKEPQYCVDIDGYGEVSWYYESQLLPIMLNSVQCEFSEIQTLRDQRAMKRICNVKTVKYSFINPEHEKVPELRKWLDEVEDRMNKIYSKRSLWSGVGGGFLK